MRTLGAVLVLGIAVGVAGACADAGPFACETDTECLAPGQAGRCELTGWCSFPDGQCASGRRYGEHAGDGLAGRCTDEPVADTGSDAAMTAGPGPGATGSGGSSGVSTGPAGSDGSTTVEVPATCGDGDVQAPEACDDGNDIDGDGCNADCVVSGTLLWSVALDGGAAGYDAGRDLLVLPGGHHVIAGTVTTMAGATEPALVRYDESDPVWGRRPALDQGFAGENGDAWGVALLSTDTLVVAGRFSAMDLGFAQSYQADDGTPGWDYTFGTGAFDVAAAAGGPVWIAGSDNVLGAPVLVQLNADGVETGAATAPDIPDTGTAWDVAVLGDDAVAIGDAGGAAWIHRISGASLGLQWTAIPPFVASSSAAYGVAARGDLFAVSGIFDAGGTNDGWVGLFDDSGDDLWTRTQGSDAGTDNIHHVALSDAGDVAAVGWIALGGQDSDIWVAKYDPGGDLRWFHTATGDAGDEDIGWAVAFTAGGGVIATGSVINAATGVDLWMAAYAP